jgi:xylulokinase
MTGKFVTEASVAWLTGLVDVHNAAWWPTSCGMQGVHLSRLPEIVRAGADLGPLLPGVGEELGVPRDCRFIVGCLDQFAGAIGGGNALPGDVSETTGTVLATVRRSKTFQESRRARVLQGPTSTCGEYFQMIFGGPSATLLENYRNLILERPSFEQLDEWAAEATDSNGIVLDRVALERQECRFLNRHAGHSIGNEVYAILETVADNLVEQVGTLCGEQRPTEVRSAGGAARSKLWQRIKSEKLGCPVMASECEEPTSLGAAMLAHRAIHGTSLEQLSEDWIKTRCADDLSL